MNMDEVSRVIGALEAGQEAQEQRHETLAAKVDSMDGKLDLLLANQDQQRGARKVLLWGVGFGSPALGALASAAWNYITTGGPRHP